MRLYELMVARDVFNHSANVLSLSRILRFLVRCSITILNQRMIADPKSSYASIVRNFAGIVKYRFDFGFFGLAPQFFQNQGCFRIYPCEV